MMTVSLVSWIPRIVPCHACRLQVDPDADAALASVPLRYEFSYGRRLQTQAPSLRTRARIHAERLPFGRYAPAGRLSFTQGCVVQPTGDFVETMLASSSPEASVTRSLPAGQYDLILKV